jgi:uncharacterized repeat protein (TIGR02543 family)
LPGATRSGYAFKGWSESSTASSGITGSYTPSKNVTLYATWEKLTNIIWYELGERARQSDAAHLMLNRAQELIWGSGEPFNLNYDFDTLTDRYTRGLLDA